jgi:hypothetical protein
MGSGVFKKLAKKVNVVDRSGDVIPVNQGVANAKKSCA